MKTMTQLYIDEIINSLVVGHASVLVGAGFSRNADPANEDVKSPMPTWWQLSDVFCEKLGITDKNYLDSLALAQEVQETYGRPYLDKLISEQLKNEMYNPSDLHVNLMSLPWTDVFTTNYDTLLERACKQVTSRKYLPVVDQKDLLYSSGQPRIIKLHGSFPSNGPFVITEEDFRTYPNDHAPFVNTVQQSLLENTFCLIGFSGNDPNFLKWIGWIHDNLGLKNSPKIFMISHKALSPAKTKTLASKNIEVIVLDDIQEYHEQNIRDAHSMFLQCLINGVQQRIKEREHWPDPHTVNRYKNGEEKKFYLDLKKLHDSYPGWIIAPYKKHTLISRITNNIDDFLRIITDYKEQTLSYALEIAYEFCWFYSIMGRPLFNHELNKISIILERSPSRKEEKIYKFIEFNILYACRIHGLEDKWQKTFKQLESSNLDNDEKIRLKFEDAMHQIYTFKFDDLEKTIDFIDIDKTQSEWALKKSGLLAMIGKYDEAKAMIKDSLSHVRYVITQNTGFHSVHYHSIESCLVILYNYVIQASQNQFPSMHNVEMENELQKDLSMDFVWQNENDHYKDILTNQFEYIGNHFETPQFDIGRITYTTTFSEDSDALNAYDFIGFREITGIPFRLGHIVLKDGTLGASKRLCHYNCFIPLVLGYLTSDTKIIENIITRQFLANTNQDVIDHLVDICGIALKNAMASYVSNNKNEFDKNFREYALNVMPEVLSRLVTKCNENKFPDLIRLLHAIYNFNNKIAISNVNNLLTRMIKSMPIKVLLDSLDEFWTFPVLENNDRINQEYPDPFTYIYDRVESIPKKCHNEKSKLPMNEKKSAELAYLFLMSNDEKSRKNYIRRITYLSEIYNFSYAERKEMGKCLLHPTNLDENGIPYLGDFYPSVLSDFLDEYPTEKLNEFYSKCWGCIINSLDNISKKSSISSEDHILTKSISLAEKCTLSEDTFIKLMNTLLSVCDKFDKDCQKKISLFGNYEPKNNLQLTGQLIGEILLKNQKVSEKKSFSSSILLDIQEILSNNNIPRSLLTWCLFKNEREDILINYLSSGEVAFINEAKITIYRLSAYGIKISDNIIEFLINGIITSNSYEVNCNALTLNYLINRGLLSTDQCNVISNSLKKYDRITQLHENDSEKIIADKIGTRRTISLLANSLYRRYRDTDHKIPDGINYWKTISKAQDEFAEIKNCWAEI